MILEAADIRSIEQGTALLLASGARPVLLELRAWTALPGADRIDAARRRAEAAIQRAARGSTLGVPPGRQRPHAGTAETPS
jgi:hypothetical protein